MPDKTFLEEYGLYRKFEFPKATVLTLQGIPTPALQLHCSVCKGERTWNELPDRRQSVDPREGFSWQQLIGGTMVDDPPCPHSDPDLNVAGRIVSLVYACGGCGKRERQMVTYFVLFGREPRKASTSPKSPRKAKEPPAETRYVKKVGQHPAWAIDPPKDLKDALGQYEALYKKGMICESQGYGIGAFAYFRRIVENIIDQMLADIGELLVSEERAKYEAALEKVKDSKIADEKIVVVKDMLPAVLRPGGANPLGLLHDAMSVALHALDEDECLALAEGVRKSLVMLSKHIALARQDRDEFAASIGSVKNRLDKIKRKQKGHEQEP